MILICPGVIILALAWLLIVSRPLVLHVPDGERPMAYWAKFRAGRWYKRLEVWEIFMLFMGIGLVFGGIIGAITGL